MPYMDDPEYQRAIQKINALPPHIRAVIDPTGIARRFAARDMERTLQLMRLGNQQRMSQKQLDLTEKQYDWQTKQQKYANILAAVGIPISAASGYLQLREKRQLADLYRNALSGGVK